MYRLYHIILCIALSIVLIGCAGLFKKSAIPIKETLLNSTEQKHPPQSVKALWTITTYGPGKSKNTFKGVLTANPYVHYKINWLGPLNISVGSFTWKENYWKFKVPGAQREGQGEYVPILGEEDQGISIHSLMEFMWNGYLQKNLYLVPSSKPNFSTDRTEEKLYVTDKNLYVYVQTTPVDSIRISLVESLYKHQLEKEYRLKFREYQNIQGYNIPRYVEVYNTGVLQAIIKVSKVRIQLDEE
jgi:hypothetical protein